MGNEPMVGDAFGAALRVCWTRGAKPGAVLAVVERDDGYVSVEDCADYLAAPAQWPPLDRQACDRAHGRILDVGCGGGRHAAVLHAAGRDVVGIDPSPGAVALTRERGVPAHLGTARDPGTGLGAFDTFLLLGNNLGLLGTPTKAPAVLAALARLARPGAHLYGTGVDSGAGDLTDHRAYQERNRAHGRLPGQLRLRLRYGRLATDWFDYLFAAPTELCDLVAGTPWEVTDIVPAAHHYLAELTFTAAPPSP